MTENVTLQTEHMLLIALAQVGIIILASRLFGAAFRRMGQPQVCGEIAAGLILGPSLLGGLFPGAFRTVFDPAVAPAFSVLSQFGLVLVLFLIGLEFDFRHLRSHARTPVLISLVGIALPFALGIGVAQVLHPHVGQGIERVGFSLFIGTALSITALPVLGRIMVELGLNRTRLGTITITAAAVDDVVGWTLLALVMAVVRTEVHPWATVAMMAQTIGFVLVMVLAVRPLAHRWATRSLHRSGGELSLHALGAVLILVFAAAMVTSLIGIFALFGGFVAGAILSDHAELRQAVHGRLNDFVTVFFLPVFFTYTGLRTDVGSVQGTTLVLLCGLVLLAAVAGKLGGCTLAARVGGLSWRESFSVGIMMNTRGLMELIVINVGYEVGVIPDSVFFMLVFMAVVTTFVTAPLLRRTLPGEVGSPARRVPVSTHRPAADVRGVASGVPIHP